MKPTKPVPSPKVPAQRKPFRLEKLEERIAPAKVKPFTWKCRPSW